MRVILPLPRKRIIDAAGLDVVLTPRGLAIAGKF